MRREGKVTDMRLTVVPVLPLALLLSCGGQVEDPPLKLMIDGNTHDAENTSVEVPFLQHQRLGNINVQSSPHPG